MLSGPGRVGLADEGSSGGRMVMTQLQSAVRETSWLEEVLAGWLSR